MAPDEPTVITVDDDDGDAAIFTVVSPDANNPLILSVAVEEGEISTYLAPEKIREIIDALEPFAAPRPGDLVSRPRRTRFH